MKDLSKYIDSTILKADTSLEDVKNLCQEADANGFKAICVNPYYVSYAREWLKSSPVEIATVVGFPLGANTTESKVFEAKNAVANGASEIDMVINIGAMKDGNYNLVADEIKEISQAIGGKTLKVIIETCLLTDDEKLKASQMVLDNGGDYVKTSTGFNGPGANIEDVRLIKSVVGDKIGIKASGGIRDKETAIKMIDAGATRLGTSSGLAIIK